MNNIKIYGRHTSYNVQKVLWMADELGLDYSHIQRGGRFGGNDSAEFLAMNPMGKVPVLVDDKKVIWESNTIVRYLADMYSGGNWISTDPYTRSLHDRWLDWSIDRLETAFVGVFWGYYRTPSSNHNPVAIKASVAAYEACLLQLEGQLNNQQFLVDDQISIVDIVIGVFIHRIETIELEVAIPDNIGNWYSRLTTRAGYRKWVMSDFSELKGRSGY